MRRNGYSSKWLKGSDTVIIAASRIETSSWRTCYWMKIGILRSLISGFQHVSQMTSGLKSFVAHLPIWVQKLWTKLNTVDHQLISGHLASCCSQFWVDVFLIVVRQTKNFTTKFQERHTNFRQKLNRLWVLKRLNFWKACSWLTQTSGQQPSKSSTIHGYKEFNCHSLAVL